MRRALAAAALLLTAACGGGGGGAGSAGGEPEPSEEVVCLDGSYEPVEERSVVPREQVCPEESPTSSPEPTWEPAAAFLTPEAAAQAEAPGWSVDEGYEPEAGPLLDPCGEGAFPLGADVVASDERAMGSTREAGGSVLKQEVFGYSSPEAAAAALDGYADAVERCPERQAPEGDVERFSIVEQNDVGGARHLLVQRQPCTGAGQCVAHFRSYLFVTQAGDGVTVAYYGIGEDGDPVDAARALLAAAAAQLADAVPAP